ncbi:MAG: serine protease [Caulobacteraceae bacterium]|nr:serine protease [Caulobacteraceae bacterium]
MRLSLSAWRPPDWLVYGAIVAAALAGSLSRRERAMAPEPPPPVPGAAGMPISPDSPLAASPITSVTPAAARGAQTGFSVGEAGVWMTAAAGLGRCRTPGVVAAEGRAAPAVRRPGADAVLVVTTPGAGAPGVPLAAMHDLQAGELGFVPGFPKGGPGEVAARLLGPQTRRVLARFEANEPVLAWAEIGHTEGLKGARPGLVGAPVLDRAGRAVGVLLGESPRRGRIYTTTPDGLRRALAAAGVTPGAAGAGQPIGTDNYGRAADGLRRDLRVVQVVCLRAG